MTAQRSLACLLLLLLSGFMPASVAQNRYQVEVIVFEHLSASEARIRQDQRPDWEAAVRPDDADTDSFTAVSSSGFRMAGVYRVLRSSQHYRPMVHRAWLQDGLSDVRAQPVLIASDNGQIEGTVRLRKTRYLHVDVDLVYPIGTDRYARLQQSQRLKLKELHYFDHPLFGAIVQVTRANG